MRRLLPWLLLLAACGPAVPADDDDDATDPIDELVPGFGPFPDEIVGSGGGGPCGIAHGDFDGDGQLDLAVSHIHTGDVSLLLQIRSGDFVGAWHQYGHLTPLEVGGELGVIHAEDFDGDGDTDLATTVGTTDELIVLNNPGQQLSSVPLIGQTYDVGAFPYGVASADLDGDGELDLVVSNGSGGDLSVLMGSEDGFADAVFYDVGGDEPGFVVLGDTDGDGRLDAVTTNHFSSTAAILRGNGDGTFDPPLLLNVGDGPSSPELADIDGDGDLDLITANEFSSDVSVLINQGNGVYEQEVRIEPGLRPYFVDALDVDGDGDLDLAIPLEGEGRLVIWANEGGVFEPRWSSWSGEAPSSLTHADLDGDGDLDLAATNYFEDTVSIFLNRIGD